MVKVSVDQMRQRLVGIEQRRRHYEWQSEQPGRLKRHEMWRHAYLARPYLLGAPDDRVAERFGHVFMNAMELSPEGKVCPVSLSETDEFMQVFTHLLEEYGSRRGGLPPDVISSARAPLTKYFDNGEPPGVRMFRGYAPPPGPILVKYGSREFLEPMLKTGNLRLSNAAFYSHSALLDSIRDDETSRTFFIPTYSERMAGQAHLDFQGKRILFDNDDLVLPLTFDDYYLFSLCEHIHYRMPTDFNSDAAIVITDPVRFQQRLISAFLARFPDWVPMHGKVTYYDPYRDYTKFKVPEMAKHFGYAYQKEVRIALRPRHKPSNTLEPLFLSVGPMTDYADLVSL